MKQISRSITKPIRGVLLVGLLFPLSVLGEFITLSENDSQSIRGKVKSMDLILSTVTLETRKGLFTFTVVPDTDFSYYASFSDININDIITMTYLTLAQESRAYAVKIEIFSRPKEEKNTVFYDVKGSQSSNEVFYESP